MPSDPVAAYDDEGITPIETAPLLGRERPAAHDQETTINLRGIPFEVRVPTYPSWWRRWLWYATRGRLAFPVWRTWEADESGRIREVTP